MTQPEEPKDIPSQETQFQTTKPHGTLTLQTLSMPADTNPQGDIFGGWLLSQMDIAGAIMALEIAQGRVTTVAVSGMKFLNPVPVGSLVSCYSVLRAIGHTSIRIGIEVWIKDFKTHQVLKVTEGEFVYVAIDANGNKRPVNALI
ncbi:MAG: acyl-CoA thioesterase [Gammaproteobacteria bacterium]|nr:MAG: acyl-CoA thioesterase [Gammaproteobacteria bacterium]